MHHSRSFPLARFDTLSAQGGRYRPDSSLRLMLPPGFSATARPLLPLPLEHVPKKLVDFFEQNMLQLFDFERFLFDQVIPHDRKAL
jgi:hypothetical protein